MARRAPARMRIAAADPLAGSAAARVPKKMKSGRAIFSNSAARLLDRAFHQALCLSFQFQPRILMGLGPGQGCDTLHEVKDAFGFPVFFAKSGFNNLRRFRFGKPALAQEA